MRKFIFSVFCLSIMMATWSRAQELAMYTPPVKEEKSAVSAKKVMERKYVFNVYGEIPVMETTFEEKHFLGDALSDKWNTFCKNYTRVYEVSVGLSGAAVEIEKPSVYNAVQKVNKYYKKAVKSKRISKEEAIRTLSHILDCANVICMEHETKAFEEAIAEVKDPEQIIILFKNVELKFL